MHGVSRVFFWMALHFLAVKSSFPVSSCPAHLAKAKTFWINLGSGILLPGVLSADESCLSWGTVDCGFGTGTGSISFFLRSLLSPSGLVRGMSFEGGGVL